MSNIIKIQREILIKDISDDSHSSTVRIGHDVFEFDNWKDVLAFLDTVELNFKTCGVSIADSSSSNKSKGICYFIYTCPNIEDRIFVERYSPTNTIYIKKDQFNWTELVKYVNRTRAYFLEALKNNKDGA